MWVLNKLSYPKVKEAIKNNMWTESIYIKTV